MTFVQSQALIKWLKSKVLLAQENATSKVQTNDSNTPSLNKDTLDELLPPFSLSPYSNKTNLQCVEKGEDNKNVNNGTRSSLEVEGCLNNGGTDISLASKSGMSNL